MADQDIQFKVTADVQDAKQGFDEVQGKIDGMTDSAKETVPVMNEASDAVQDVGDVAGEVGGSVGGLSSMMVTGLVAAAAAAGLALIGLAKDFLETDGEVENLTAKMKEHWSEVFKATQEWKAFEQQLKGMNLDEIAASLEGNIGRMAELSSKMALSWYQVLDAIGLIDASGELGILAKEQSLLLKSQTNKNREDWERSMFGMSISEMKEWFFSQKKVSESADDGWKLAAKAADEYIKKLVEAVEKEIDGYDKITTHKNKIMGSLLSPKKTKGKPGPGFDDEDVRRAFLEENAFFLDTAISSAGILRNEFMTVWTDVFGEANSLFEKFVANMVEQLANLAATNLMGSILNFIVPGLGTAAGMVMSSGSTSSVINLQLDNQTMGSWYVSGKNQAERLRLS